MDAPPDHSLAIIKQSRMGPAPVLQPDASTLKTLRSLARIQATTREFAAGLGVTEPTFLKFRDDNPVVAQTIEENVGKGKISLRRRQIEVAMKGNAQLLIWTGKQYLGQTDKTDTTITVSLEDLVMGSIRRVGGGAQPAIEGESRALEGPETGGEGG